MRLVDKTGCRVSSQADISFLVSPLSLDHGQVTSFWSSGPIVIKQELTHAALRCGQGLIVCIFK